ncbi:MAG: pantetheine-phosphate adenylyltransferase [Promethearchaeota archaeon]
MGEEQKNPPKFAAAGMGGTFDHLHEGHELLLTTALRVAERVIVGLSTDELLREKGQREKIQPYETRKRGILEFVGSIAGLDRVRVVPLSDPYGPAITSEEIEALVISAEPAVIPNARKINEVRLERGLRPLVLVVVPLVTDEDGNKISSTKIRERLP